MTKHVRTRTTFLIVAGVALLLQGCGFPFVRPPVPRIPDDRHAIQRNAAAFWTGVGCAVAAGTAFAVAQNQGDEGYAWSAYGVGLGFSVATFVLFAYTFKDSFDERRTTYRYTYSKSKPIPGWR